MKNKTIFGLWGAGWQVEEITVPSNNHSTSFTAGIINRLSLLAGRWDGKFLWIPRRSKVGLNAGFHLRNEYIYFGVFILSHCYQFKFWAETGPFLWLAILQYNIKETVLLPNRLQPKCRELQKQFKCPGKQRWPLTQVGTPPSPPDFQT